MELTTTRPTEQSTTDKELTTMPTTEESTTDKELTARPATEESTTDKELTATPADEQSTTEMDLTTEEETTSVEPTIIITQLMQFITGTEETSVEATSPMESIDVETVTEMPNPFDTDLETDDYAEFLPEGDHSYAESDTSWEDWVPTTSKDKRYIVIVCILYLYIIYLSLFLVCNYV